MQFSYTKMNVCCEEMQAVIHDIKEVLSDITKVESELSRNGIWQGDASKYYLNNLKGLIHSFDSTNIALENQLNYLRQTIEGYQSIDQSITANIHNILGKGI